MSLLGFGLEAQFNDHGKIKYLFVGGILSGNVGLMGGGSGAVKVGWRWND